MLIYLLPDNFLTDLIRPSRDSEHSTKQAYISREQDLLDQGLLFRLPKKGNPALSVSPNAKPDTLTEAWPSDPETHVLAFAYIPSQQIIRCYLLHSQTELAKFFQDSNEHAVSFTRWFCTQKTEEFILNLKQSPTHMLETPSPKTPEPPFPDDDDVERSPPRIIEHKRPASAPADTSPRIANRGRMFLPVPQTETKRTHPSVPAQTSVVESTPLLRSDDEPSSKSCCNLL